MSKGICCAGYMCVDSMYSVEKLPKKSELGYIIPPIENVTGGSVCNTGLDIAIMDPSIKLQACGVVGDDAYGAIILHEFHKHPNVDCSMIKQRGTSAFSLVMNDLSDHTRTFYECEGSYIEYCEDDINFDELDVDIFHIGYLLLMPALDSEDKEFGTKMARLLHRVKEMGIKTSIDVISETGEEAEARFRKVVKPALKYTDYCVINELEAQNITGVKLRDAKGTLHVENFKAACEKLKELGVATWAVVHCPELSAGVDENGNYVESKSLKLPQGYIKGSTGAGDAFCAGILLAAEKGQDLKSALKLGACAAAASLSEVDSISGMKEVNEVIKLFDLYGQD